MAWRVARSLDTLLAQYDARFPDREKHHDGSIGDTRHQKTKSDHNPDANGIVKARDYTATPAQGDYLANAALQTMKSRGQRGYVIWNYRIANPSIQGGAWRRYTGVNPHDKHVHVSVHTQIDSTAAWDLPYTGHAPGGIVGAFTVDGKTLIVDGDLGPGTVTVLQRFLVKHGLAVAPADGRLRPATVKALQKWLVSKGAALPRYGADGDFGGESARALEKVLGLPAEKVDGWYPGLVRGLQRFLNNEINEGRL